MRLHAVFAPDGTPRAARLVGADRPERGIALSILPSALHGGELVIGDKATPGASSHTPSASSPRPCCVPLAGTSRVARRQSRRSGQRIESIFWSCKGLLGLERHGARTLRNLRARIAQRLLALTACVYLNHWLGRPPGAIVDFVI